jgi:hypothetical protein
VHSIVSRHLHAMGGKHKLRSIRSLFIETSVDERDGEKFITRTWIVKDKLYRKEFRSTNPGTFILTPTQGWSSNPHGSNWWPTAQEAVKSQQHQLDPTDPFLDYAHKGYTVEADGKDTIHGKECYRLKVNFIPQLFIIYSIEAKSGYILRSTQRGAGPDGWFRMDYDDYRRTPDGYIFPYKIMGAGVTKLEINTAIDVDLLSKPKWIRTATAQASYKYGAAAGK